MNIFSPPYQVVIIEDDDSVSKLMSHYLNEEFKGMLNVRCFLDVKSALQIIKEDLVHIVIVDLHLGEERGEDALKECVSAEKGMQLVAMSADQSLIKAIDCFNIGAQYFLEKPLKKKQLVEVIRLSITHLKYWHEVIRQRIKGA